MSKLESAEVRKESGVVVTPVRGNERFFSSEWSASATCATLAVLGTVTVLSLNQLADHYLGSSLPLDHLNNWKLPVYSASALVGGVISYAYNVVKR